MLRSSWITGQKKTSHVITFLKLWQLLSSLSSFDQFPWTFLWLYYTVVTILHDWQEICKINELRNLFLFERWVCLPQHLHDEWEIVVSSSDVLLFPLGSLVLLLRQQHLNPGHLRHLSINGHATERFQLTVVSIKIFEVTIVWKNLLKVIYAHLHTWNGKVKDVPKQNSKNFKS